MNDIGITISGDVVERLMRRAHTLAGRPVPCGDGDTYIPGEYTRKDAALDQEAYAEITRLRAMVEELKADRIRINDEAETEIKRLREALEPFAETAESDIGDDEADTDPYRPMHARRAVAGIRTVGDFRRARKALEGGE